MLRVGDQGKYLKSPESIIKSQQQSMNKKALEAPLDLKHTAFTKQAALAYADRLRQGER